MYDRMVDVPRLLCSYREADPLPDATLDLARSRLNEHYRAESGEEFSSVGLCLYRDGRDSVAWHGDTFGRGRTEDTMVAILSLGAPRTLALRPRGGGPVQRYEVGHGDLLVMGGTCQRTWEHAVPKTARPPLHKVILVNDDFTPRDFVVMVLKAEFRMPEAQALKVMLTAHQKGSCVVAVFTREVAESKATNATEMARSKGYPLLFTTEPEE